MAAATPTLAAHFAALAQTPRAGFDAFWATFNETQWQALRGQAVAMCELDIIRSLKATGQCPTETVLVLNTLDSEAMYFNNSFRRLRQYFEDQGCTVREENLPESNGDDLERKWHITWAPPTGANT